MIGHPTILQTVAYVVLCTAFGVFSLLDGFDLGAVIAAPFIAPDRKSKEALYSLLTPVWDGNEVWLIIGGGLLFSFFPRAFAGALSGFYPAVFCGVIALMFRAGAFEFRYLGGKGGGRFWDAVLWVSSLAVVVVFGLALGNVVAGIPLDGSGAYRGGFAGLFRPMPLFCALIALVAVTGHGLAVASASRDGTGSANAVSGLRFVAFANAACAASGIMLISILGHAHYPSVWFLISVAAGGIALGTFALSFSSTVRIGLTSAGIIGWWGAVATLQWPILIRSTGAGPSLDISAAASAPHTLRVMVILCIAAFPVIGLFTAYVYRVFRKSGSKESVGY